MQTAPGDQQLGGSRQPLPAMLAGYLLPADSALLPVCSLARRLCKATRGHRGGHEGVWPLVPQTPLLSSQCSGAERRDHEAEPPLDAHLFLPSPLPGMGSRQRPCASLPPSQESSRPASLPLSQGEALQSECGLQGELGIRTDGEGSRHWPLELGRGRVPNRMASGPRLDAQQDCSQCRLCGQDPAV